MIILGTTLTKRDETDLVKIKKPFKEYNIIKTSQVIDVSADRLWEIASDFENVSLWSSNIKEAVGSGLSRFEGATCEKRTCQVEGLKNYSTVVEKLVHFSNDQRALAYELIEGAPGFMLLARNRWTIIAVGSNQSKIKMHVTMRLKKFMGFLLGRQLKKTVNKALPVAMNDLKVFAETGEGSPAKQAQQKRLKHK